jgi:hypothetical protein
MRGLRWRTSLPTSKSLFLTFGFLQDLVSSCYFCKFATALSLFYSNKSFSSTSLGHGTTSAFVRRLWSKQQSVWGEICGSAGCCVLTQYGPGHDLRPFALLFAVEYFLKLPKKSRRWLTQLLRWIVGGTLMWRRHLSESNDKNPWTWHYQNTSCVNGDLLWNSITTDDILPKEFLDSSRGYVGDGLRFDPFGEVLHCDNGKGVVSLC